MVETTIAPSVRVQAPLSSTAFSLQFGSCVERRSTITQTRTSSFAAKTDSHVESVIIIPEQGERAPGLSRAMPLRSTPP
jgi:hypothetical protein